MKLTKQQEAEVMPIYKDWWHSYMNGDVKTYDHYLDDDFWFVGSTEAEAFLSRPDTTKFFDATAEQLDGKSQLRNSQLTAEYYDGIVFITELADAYLLFGDEWTFYGKFRFSSMLKKNKEGWRFIYQHFSTPDSKTEEGETIGFDKVNAENQELREAIKRRTIELERKNRELEIEASLERVRSRTMAMHKSEELSELVKLLYKEIEPFGVSTFGISIAIFRKEENAVEYWFADNLHSDLLQSYKVMGQKNRVFRQNWEDWKNKIPQTQVYLEGQKKWDFDTFILEETDFVKLPEELKQDIRSHKTVCLTFTFFKYGYFESVDLTIPNEENAKVLIRFSQVFDQTYTRFLDLQKAEAQTREAQIEAALERVRSRSLAMHKTDELQEVVRVVAEELKNTGVILDTWGAVICTYFQDSKDVLHWTAAEDPANPSIAFLLPYFKDELYDETWASKNRGDIYFAKVFSYEVKNAFFKHAFEHSDYRQLPEDYKKVILESESHGIAWAWSKNSAIMIPSIQGALPSDEEKEILIRFAKVFEQSFIRFLDLQKAEAQAREARIEGALEKVRSRTMAMQKGEELKDVAVLLYKELIALGVTNFVSCGYVEIYENINKQYVWITSPGGDTLGLFYLPLTGDVTFDERYAAWKRQQSIFHQTVAGEVRSNHLEYAITTFQSKEAEEMVRSQFPDPTVFYCFNFPHGYLHIVTGSELKEEEEVLLARFTRVFEQAYTRFLDLQKAEAQALLIRQERDRLEVALKELHATQDQLVQQEKLASLGQLTAGIAHEIKNPLNFVNNFSEVSIELIAEAMEEIAKTQHAASPIDQNNDLDEIIAILDDVQSNLHKIHEHGSRANNIVSSMLQHSRGGSGKKEPSDLNVLIREYVNLSFHGMRAGKNPIDVRINMELDDAIGDVPLIAEDFSRVILNICNNAFDAMRTVDTQNFAYLHVRTKKSGDAITVEFEDNGPGIPDDIKDKILQPFFTTKKGTEGTGLGLSITHDIVKAHGGEIRVESKEGKGTVFTIKIPLS